MNALRTKPKMWDLADLAGVTEIIHELWPEAIPDDLFSLRSQISMWASRRASSHFPEPKLALASGPIYSRREVTSWWVTYRTSAAYLRALARRLPNGRAPSRQRRAGSDATD